MNWLEFPDLGDPRPRWPLPQVLAGIAASGFTGVGIDEYSLRSLSSGSTGGDLASALVRLGLRCTDVGILRVGDLDARVHAASLARLAHELGAPTCIAVLTAPVSETTVAELETCAGLLGTAGVRLALEFAPYSPLGTLAEAEALCERVGWDRCGLLLDVWHLVRSGSPWQELRRLPGDRLALVHFADAPEQAGSDLRYESRFRRLPPGAGTFPLVEILTTLEEIGYGGVVSLEVLSAELRAIPPTDGARLLMDSARAAGFGSPYSSPSPPGR